MSLIKKSDVKNHLSARHHNRMHLAPASQPDATGFSGTNQESVKTNGADFTQDLAAEEMTAPLTGAGLDSSTDSSTPQAPAIIRAAKV